MTACRSSASSPTSTARRTRPVGQVHGLGQCRDRPASRQDGRSRSNTRPRSRAIVFQAFRCARAGEPGPVAVVIPYPVLSREVWDYDQPVPPPLPRAVRRGGLRPRAAAPDRPPAPGRHLRRHGLRRRRPVAGRGRRAAPGAGGHVGQRQGVHPRRPSPGRRLGLRQARHPRRRGGIQGRRPRAGRRRPVQRGLDGQLRDPPARHVDPRRYQPAEPRPQRADPRLRLRRRPRLPRPAPGRRRRDPAARLSRALAGDPEVAAGRPLRGRDGPRSSRASIRCSSWPDLRRAWAPTSWCSWT